MGLASFAFQLVAVLAVTLLLLNRYTDWRKQHILVYVSTAVGWYFSFLIVLVLPLDVSITFYEKCLLEQLALRNSTVTEDIAQDVTGPSTPSNLSLGCEQPRGHVDGGVLLGLWRVVYWSSQFLTWILLPVMQSYVRAGDFNAIGRLRSAMYNNVFYYAAYSGTFFLFLLYALSRGLELNFDHLKVLVISASNTWGLFLLVMLLGYSLVELPRQLWQAADRSYRLGKVYFNVDKLSTEKSDSEDAIQEVYREAKEVMNVLKSTRGPAREKAQQIMARFPPQLTQKLATSRSAPNFGRPSNIAESDAAVISSDAYLIRLHRRTIEAVQNYHRCQIQWRALVNKALYLEEVGLAESTQHLPAHWSNAFEKRGREKSLTGKLVDSIPIPNSIRYRWHVTWRRPLLLTLALVCAAMTILTLWSECTFFIVNPQLSLAARILRSAADGYHYKYIQVVAVSMLAYLGVCAYYTVFRLRIYRYYHLDQHQLTDENSLIFSTMLLCRLTAPMCLNFLGMTHLDSHITSNTKFGVETQFTKLMGHLDVVPVVARGINLYLPILIVLLCLGTWFRLGTRLLAYLGVDQFIEDDEMTTEMVQNGRALVTLERNRLNRERGMEERNRAWENRMSENRNVFGGSSGGVGATRLEKSNTDRLPIMEDQDQFESGSQLENVSTLNAATKQRPSINLQYNSARPFPEGQYSSYLQQPLEDVDLTRADDDGRESLLGRGQGACPAPSSIFDDL